MKKFILTVLCLALIFTAAGCADRNGEFTQKEYAADAERIKEVRIDVRDREIRVEPSGDEQIHIKYFESGKEFYNISDADGKTLAITAAGDKSWTDYIGGKPSAEVREIVLQLPDGLLNSLSISTTNENISVSPLTVAGNVELSVNGGNISFGQMKAGSAITLNAKNGDIEGTVCGSIDDFEVDCNVKKGSCNLPSDWNGGDKTLSVSVNNGDAKIGFGN